MASNRLSEMTNEQLKARVSELMDIVDGLQAQHRVFIDEAVRIQKEVDQAHLNVSVEQVIRTFESRCTRQSELLEKALKAMERVGHAATEAWIKEYRKDLVKRTFKATLQNSTVHS